MEYNLGNVVGLIASETPPVKKYILWAKVLNPTYEDETELRYFEPASNNWEMVRGGSWLPPVNNVDIDAPPASPVVGDSYLISNTPTGAWASHANNYAVWIGHSWSYVVPLNGSVSKSKSVWSTQYIFDELNSLWIAVDNTGGSFIKLDGTSPATTGIIEIGDGQGFRSGGDSIYTMGSTYQYQTVTDGGDLTAGSNINSSSWSATATDSGAGTISQINVAAGASYGVGFKTGSYYGYFRNDAFTADRIIQWQNKVYSGVADVTDIATAVGAYIPLAGSVTPTSGYITIGDTYGFTGQSSVYNSRAVTATIDFFKADSGYFGDRPLRVSAKSSSYSSILSLADDGLIFNSNNLSVSVNSYTNIDSYGFYTQSTSGGLTSYINLRDDGLYFRLNPASGVSRRATIRTSTFTGSGYWDYELPNYGGTFAMMSDVAAAVPALKTLYGNTLIGTGDMGIAPGAYGGTGVNNASRLLTYGGNVTFSGAFDATFVVPLTATWTLPTPASGGITGTLAGLNSVQTFTQTNTFTTVRSNVIAISDGGVGYITVLDFNAGSITLGSGGSSIRSTTLLPITNSNYDLGSSASTWRVGYMNSVMATASTGLQIRTSNTTALAAPAIEILSGNQNSNTASLFSGKIYLKTGDITNAGALSSQFSSSVFFDVGTVTGSATRGGMVYFNTSTEPNWQGGQRIFFEGNMTTAPSGNPSGGLFRWAESGNFKLRTSAGALITLGAISDFDDLRILDQDGVTQRITLDSVSTGVLRLGNGWTSGTSSLPITWTGQQTFSGTHRIGVLQHLDNDGITWRTSLTGATGLNGQLMIGPSTSGIGSVFLNTTNCFVQNGGIWSTGTGNQQGFVASKLQSTGGSELRIANMANVGRTLSIGGSFNPTTGAYISDYASTAGPNDFLNSTLLETGSQTNNTGTTGLGLIIRSGGTTSATNTNNGASVYVYTREILLNGSATSGSLLFDVGLTAAGASGAGIKGGIALFSNTTIPAWNSGQRIMYIGNRTASPTINASSGTYFYANAGNLETTGNFYFPLIGTGLGVKTGTNGRLFNATLIAGTVTVANTSITANTKALITLAPGGASGTLGLKFDYVCTAGQIVVTSLTAAGVTEILDASTVQIYLVEGL